MEIKTKPKNFLVLNNIRSAENVGAVFRICDSCNVNLILQGVTPHPKTENDDRLPYVIAKDIKKIEKTATESINNIDFLYFKNEIDTLNYIKSLNVPIYCLETNIKGSVNLFEYNKDKNNFVLIVGNEVTGVSDIFLKSCDKVLYIPMLGKNTCLNVAVSAGIALYELILG